MDISALNVVSGMIAPETIGKVSLHLCENGWPMPPGAAAVSAFDPPPWIRAKGFDGRCIVFRPEFANLESLVHELAHILPCHDAPAPQAKADRDPAIYQEAWSTPDPATLADAWHDPGFVRRCLHLAFRCEHLAGRRVDLDAAFAGCCCSDRRAEEYLEALGDEPRRCVGMPFSRIQRIDAPPEFLRLFGEEQIPQKIGEFNRHESQEQITQEIEQSNERETAGVAAEIDGAAGTIEAVAAPQLYAVSKLPDHLTMPEKFQELKARKAAQIMAIHRCKKMSPAEKAEEIKKLQSPPIIS